MKYPTMRTEHIAGLTLADGSSWEIIAANDRANDVVLAFAKVMQLQFLEKSSRKKSRHNSFRRLNVLVEDPKTDSSQLSTMIHLTFEDPDTIVYTLNSKESDEMPVPPFMHLSMVICRDAQCRGGVLLHGAFAGWNGNGVILAGPGGRGKTTASQRLPHHWQSFCDDTTLVVCDSKGMYRAHPWPTWNTFMFSEPGGTWDVQHAIPLKGIFMLKQGKEDLVSPLGVGESVCSLAQSAEQASWPMANSAGEEVRTLRLERFENICNLAKSVPAYLLHASLNGTFWEKIERVLIKNSAFSHKLNENQKN